MTVYHVFLEEHASSGGPVYYVPVEANVKAAGDQAAMRAAAKQTGTYFAIPARSFRPTPIVVEQQTVVRLAKGA